MRNKFAITIMALALAACAVFQSCWFGGTCSITGAQFIAADRIRVYVEGMDRTGADFEFEVTVYSGEEKLDDISVKGCDYGNDSGLLWKYYFDLTMSHEIPLGAKVYVWGAGADTPMSGSAVLVRE